MKLLKINKIKKNKDIRIYIDMDNVLCDYQTAYNKAIKENPEIKYPQSQYGFFRNLEPIRFAVQAFESLTKYYDTWILTAPSTRNPLCYSEKREWVERYLGFDSVEKLIISPDKSLLIGDYLIDDIEAGKAKQNQFKGTLIVFGCEKFNDWMDVLEYFINKMK